jgi:hypothetical protein
MHRLGVDKSATHDEVAPGGLGKMLWYASISSGNIF